MRPLFFLFTVAIFLSCSRGDNQTNQHIYWVNSTKASCVGMAPTKCLQTQKSETLDPLAWKSFHWPIKGFEYEPGYIYKIVVKERHLDPDNVPADASSIEYTLVEILEKKQDMKLGVNDIWIVDHINGEILMANATGITLPHLEINVGDMRYMGSDGCNNYNGGIIELDEHTVRFGVAAGTRMMCVDMTIPDLFNATLPEVKSWEIQKNKLHLYDADGKELMQLKKSD